ncbi:MAG: outer membrane protein assembly factor BamD, partial [Campylobacterales bacterium]
HKMVKEIRYGDLESADKTYNSLVSEHMRSPLLEEAVLILAQAHIDAEEYLLANFYLDEYIKRYGDTKRTKFAKFLKIKAAYLSLKRPFRDQNLLQETLQEASAYIKEYPDSPYLLQVQSMQTTMLLAKENLNREIAALYGRLGKPEAQKIYTERAKSESVQTNDEIIPPKRWLIQKLFE